MTTHKRYVNGPAPSPESAPASRWRLVFGLPRTRTGWTAVLLGVISWLLYAIFWGLIAAGRGNGGSALADPLLATTLLVADATSLTGGGAALNALIRRGERSLPVFLTVGVAITTLVFVAGAIVGP